MPKIQLVERDDQLEWLIEPHWQSFRVDANKQKRAIYQWLEANCQGEVVIYSEGKMPGMLQIDWAYQMHGDLKHYKIYFSDNDDAMLFKLTWQ